MTIRTFERSTEIRCKYGHARVWRPKRGRFVCRVCDRMRKRRELGCTPQKRFRHEVQSCV